MAESACQKQGAGRRPLKRSTLQARLLLLRDFARDWRELLGSRKETPSQALGVRARLPKRNLASSTPSPPSVFLTTLSTSTFRSACLSYTGPLRLPTSFFLVGLSSSSSPPCLPTPLPACRYVTTLSSHLPRHHRPNTRTPIDTHLSLPAFQSLRCLLLFSFTCPVFWRLTLVLLILFPPPH